MVGYLQLADQTSLVSLLACAVTERGHRDHGGDMSRPEAGMAAGISSAQCSAPADAALLVCQKFKERK